MKIISGSHLTDLWFNLLIYVACEEPEQYFHPYAIFRNLIIHSDTLDFKNPLLIKDFYKYSGYNKSMKLGQLRKDYYSGKVEKQIEVLKKYFKDFSIRQARAAIYFSEPSFNKTSKLKCLESLYLQKITHKEYEALIVFRNTEIYPKLFMDLVFLKELLNEIDQETGSKCISVNGIIVHSFINVIQVKLIKMLLSDWGIGEFSNSFNYMVQEFDRKYPNLDSIEKIKLTSIKRTLKRTFQLLEKRNDQG